MNNDLHVTHTPDARRWRMATRAVVGGVVLVWLAAALMVWSLVPQLVANDPSLVGSAADVFTALSIVALVVCVSGAAMLGGLAIVWRAPERAVGRVIMLVSGLVATTFGLLLLNGSTLQTSPEFRWDGTVALTLGVVTGTFIAVGLLAVAAAISRLLPGQSIAERMMPKERTGHARFGWGAMLVLTATLIVSWVVLANASLASHTL